MNAIDLSKPPVPTNSERNLVKQYILLPVLLSVLQRDLDTIRQSDLRLSLSPIFIIQRMMESVRDDLGVIRGNLGRSGIRIYTEERGPSGIVCKYVCRGYHETVSLSRGDVKGEVGLLAGRYADMMRGA